MHILHRSVCVFVYVRGRVRVRGSVYERESECVREGAVCYSCGR